MTEEEEVGPPPAEDETAAPPSAEGPAPGGGSSRRRSPEFKQELLRRLPTLAAPQWQASETLNVYQELQGIVDLDADAFLQPLAKIADERHE